MEQEINDPNGSPFAVLPVYRCPSDDGPDLNTHCWGNNSSAQDPSLNPANEFTTNPNKPVGTSNYVAMHHHRAHDNNDWRATGNLGDRHVHTGVFGLNTRRGFRDISDGLSNTMLVGERSFRLPVAITVAVNPTQGFGTDLMYAASWAGTARVWYDDAIDDVLGTGRAPINASPNIYQKDWRQQGLSSLHKGGVQIVMGDGAVRFVSENVEFRSNALNNTSAADSIYERLISMNDGQVLGEF